MAVLVSRPSMFTLPPPLASSSDHRHLHFLRSRHLTGNTNLILKLSNFRFKSSQDDSVSNPDLIPEDQNSVSDFITIKSIENKPAGNESLFLSKLGILLGIAAVITLISAGVNQTSPGTSTGIQFLLDGSTLSAPTNSFSFRAFGYRVLLPEYAPGWVYFWLLMAAGCGLFISEEALNIWVGISLARLLTLDGTWPSLVDSFSRNAPYMISTVVWVYWGVCISDMIPFYLGKIFRKSGASDDICSKLGIGKEKAVKLTHAVQRYGNLIGFVERFSLGVRNPTAFLAGAMDISPECFFAGVCCGGLVTLPLQGIWTVFPYAVAALTALFFYVRRRYST
ncbi:hypothetical protein PHJA_001755300 [Phtheirospermum japonicum]|uniref:VTT domain-containing protein n=1 Tax=Phtheirospermum japonicum TaxID=374723 RepID=A0A830CCR7_9LAMI|nr:hypothetical protein PHJA_001755300 [Phtheirospermum japonicum]